jgi:hypothetical protein
MIVEGEWRAVGESNDDMIGEVAVMLGRYYWQLGTLEFVDLHRAAPLRAARRKAHN